MVNDDLEQRRSTRLRAYPSPRRSPGSRPNGRLHSRAIVASVCAYEEEGNIAHVLEKMPVSVNGEPYTTVVVVDGGDDRTAEIARSFPGVVVIEFPVNLGHGVALQVTYRYCVNHDVKYVVTLDADGQNDPRRFPDPRSPARRHVGLRPRQSGPRGRQDYRQGSQTGVRFFSFIMNRMTNSHITDTSTGYRALRVTMLADVVDRLRQQQYQTSELLITCLKRGWRVSEVPTEWYPRVSGETKRAPRGPTVPLRPRVFGTWWRER